jgi:alpha-ribazole phosphatase
MSARLLIVRHGQTDWNSNGRFQGQIDVPLNPAGVKQAQAVARRLSSERPAAIYASDLQRAWRTAEAIHQALPADKRCPLIAEPRLQELCFGEWEGLTYQQIRAAQGQLLQRWENDLEHNAPPGGETLLALADRVQAALRHITQAYPDACILLVAHGGPLRMLIASALGLPPQRFWQLHLSNASLSELNLYPEGAILNQLNSTSHLEKIKWED